jgi:hypothetical protein
VRYFSVAYRPLDWPMPEMMEVVSTCPAGDGVTDISASAPQFAGRDPVLGEYATLFALRRLLEGEKADGRYSAGEFVGISHYRRFAVTRATGKRSFVYGVVTPEEFLGLPRDLFVPPPGTIVFPSPIRVNPTLVGQYGHYHPTRDLLYFMGLAVDLGVITDAQATEWLSGEVMVPAPAIGVYPLDWFIATQTALETVVDAFESTVAVAREGYQQRAIAFCLERLHGLLLSTLVSTWPDTAYVAHPAMLVSPDGDYHPTEQR